MTTKLWVAQLCLLISSGRVHTDRTNNVGLWAIGFRSRVVMSETMEPRACRGASIIFILHSITRYLDHNHERGPKRETKQKSIPLMVSPSVHITLSSEGMNEHVYRLYKGVPPPQGPSPPSGSRDSDPCVSYGDEKEKGSPQD